MPGDDLKDHATSSHDFYALLGVNFETSESDIRRAYRRTALKYHPDKNAGNAAALEKFHLLQIAYDVLSDPTAKAIYDQTRRARKEKEERESAFEGRRRQMKEDLERRESGYQKRKREDDDAEEALAREIKRLAADGARRRREREELLNRERLEEEERLDQERNGFVDGSVAGNDHVPSRGGTEVPELDRSVKVRWVKEGAGAKLDEQRLSTLFSRFGKIESVILFKKERKMRVNGHRDKVLVATGVVVFASVVGAHAAVESSARQPESEFSIFTSVFWAADKEPDFLRKMQQHTTPSDSTSMPSPPGSETPQKGQQKVPSPAAPRFPPSTPLKAATNTNGPKKVPSFASFSPANTPGTRREEATASGDSPSYEELTLIRLRNAGKKRQQEQERRKLEEQIRREEEATEEARS